jgi:hypothetical protein
MSGYQFIRINTYARIPNAKFDKQSIWGIVHEADRVPHACLHIQEPKPPLLLFGEPLNNMAQKLYNLADQCHDTLHRKIRIDAQLLLAGIASYPKKAHETDYNDEHFQSWLKQSIEFLKDEYGDCLRSIILHSEDESHPHIHFYAYPNPDESGVLNIRDIHVGMKARDTVKDKGLGSGKKRRKLYKDAMRELQDRYYAKVGISSGLARLGPKRQRLTRKEWRDEQNRCERLEYYEQQKKQAAKLNKALTQSNNLNSTLLGKLKKEKLILEKENFQKLELSQNSWLSKSKKVDYLLSKNKKLKNNNQSLLKKYTAIKSDYQAARENIKSLSTGATSLKNQLSKLHKLLDEKKHQLEFIKDKYHKALQIIRDPLRLFKNSRNIKNTRNEVTYES